MIQSNKQKGFSLVEVLIGAMIITVAVVSIIGAYGFFLRAELRSVRTVQATYLLDSGVEAVRYMRDLNWDNNIGTLSNNTNYYLINTASSTSPYYVWKATTTKQIFDGIFERTFKLESVYRSSTSSDIVLTGGLISTSTCKLTITVSWPDTSGETTTKSLSTYLTNLYE